MYLKITKKVTDWIYGAEYSQAKVGDIIYVSGQHGGLLRADGLADCMFGGAELDAHVAQMEQHHMAVLRDPQITLAALVHSHNQKEFNV